MQCTENEESPVGKAVIAQLLENNKIAAEEKIPICQDTGMAVLFVEYGERVVIDGNFKEAVEEGVRRAYIGGYLRKSVVTDPVLIESILKIILLQLFILILLREIRLKFLLAVRALAVRICLRLRCLHHLLELRA